MLLQAAGASSPVRAAAAAAAGRFKPASESELKPPQVPAVLYDRSVAVFGAALVIDVLNSLFELRTTKLDFALLPCFIKGMATTTNALLRAGRGAVVLGAGGRM